MSKSKEFLEGKEAALEGDFWFPNPYKKQTIEQYRDWAKGWYAGSKERLNNLSPEEKAEYWEEKWRQSELEKYKVKNILKRFAVFADEIWEMQPTFQNPIEKVLYKNDKGETITLGDCIKAERALIKYTCADIKEIRNYEKRKFEQAVKREKKKEEERKKGEN